MNTTGVSFVVPVHNGERWLDEALACILAQRDGRPFEVIAVDDGSTDGSASILARRAAAGEVRVLRAAKRGAAAAMNQGIRETSQPVICVVDQDVELKPGWTTAILEPFREPDVGAVQGYFVTDPQAPIVARVAGMDLEQRYAAIGEGRTNHVCTGNSAYRAKALHKAGLFDESFGYGYDNDMSYRLMKAGYALRFCPGAKSIHRWRETVRGYLVQQYGQGYGRLDIVWKHPGWVAGDAVSPSLMMAHAPLMTAAIGLQPRRRCFSAQPACRGARCCGSRGSSRPASRSNAFWPASARPSVTATRPDCSSSRFTFFATPRGRSPS